LRKRSKKTEKLYVQRRAFVERLLKERPWCERGLVLGGCYEGEGRAKTDVHRSTLIHEIKLRSAGGDILDGDNCLALCIPDHVWIHHHPKEAQRLGWLKRRFECKSD